MDLQFILISEHFITQYILSPDIDLSIFHSSIFHASTFRHSRFHENFIPRHFTANHFKLIAVGFVLDNEICYKITRVGVDLD